MRIILSLLMVLMLILCQSCKKYNPQVPDNAFGLPNASHNGSGIFAFLLNGEVQIINVDINHVVGKITTDSVTLVAELGDVHIFKLLAFSAYKNVQISIPYALQNEADTRFYYATDSTCLGSISLISVTKAFGFVQYSLLDTTRRIMSGNFEFKIPIPNCDSLLLSNGRFDIKY